MGLFRLLSAFLYGLVAVAAFVMARKGLRAAQLLPFQEKAAGAPWAAIDARLQAVIVVLLNQTGLGFLVVSAQLIAVVVETLWVRNTFVAWVLPILSLTFCVGLAFFNYRLYRQTSVRTPWKGSLYAAATIAAALVLSFV